MLVRTCFLTLVALAVMPSNSAAAVSGCHMELRPTGLIGATYPNYGTVSGGAGTVGASCEGNCSGASCPTFATSSDPTGTYRYCPECPGGEENCCHAIVREVLCEDGHTICHKASSKGLCGGQGCSAGTCSLWLQTGGYWIGQCK